jgi:hypothetical protein
MAYSACSSTVVGEGYMRDGTRVGWGREAGNLGRGREGPESMALSR